MDRKEVKFPTSLDAFLGNPRAVEVLRRAVELDRLPHALIFAGPAGVGKRTLAILLAQLLNCRSPVGRGACGVCPSCRKIAVMSHPDVRVIEPDGAFIKIEQVRQLIGEIAYQPFEGRYRVAILDGAEQMRQEAANSLLKTLEEPPSRTVIVLVTANPYLLLTTIRSRCRLLQFGGIPEDRIEAYLVACEGWDQRDARLAAELSQGSLGRALGFDPAAHLETRDRALRFLTLLLTRGSFAEASRLIAATAKDKDAFEVWLDSVRTALQKLYYAKTVPDRAGLQDGPRELRQLAEATSAPAVASAIRAVDRLRLGLQFNLNRQVAAESLFLQVRELEPSGL